MWPGCYLRRNHYKQCLPVKGKIMLLRLLLSSWSKPTDSSRERITVASSDGMTGWLMLISWQRWNLQIWKTKLYIDVDAVVVQESTIMTENSTIPHYIFEMKCTDRLIGQVRISNIAMHLMSSHLCCLTAAFEAKFMFCLNTQSYSFHMHWHYVTSYKSLMVLLACYSMCAEEIHLLSKRLRVCACQCHWLHDIMEKNKTNSFFCLKQNSW